jgi:hypothetical protein
MHHDGIFTVLSWSQQPMDKYQLKQGNDYLNEWIPENELEPVRETVTGEPQDGCNLVPDSGIFTDL